MSQIATHCIKLDWKSFNVDLALVEAWMKANAGASYCGNQASSQLELWFTAEPEQSVKDAIAAHWEALHDNTDEAVSYTSAADIAKATAAKKASGKAKLLALGLTEDEVNAILG